MGKMQRLARDIRALETQLDACTRCGMCQAVCPLFKQTRKEADVARGKIALIDGLIQEMFVDAQGVNQRLSRCLLCGSCAHSCPSNVDILQIFLRARHIIARYLRLPFAKKLLLEKILAHPETFNRFTAMVEPFQRLFFKKQDNVQATSCARIASPLLRHRNLVLLTAKPFHSGMESVDCRVDEKGLTIGFFVGCLIDKAFPGIAHNVVTILKHFKTRIVIPQDQGCCGIPAAAAGDMKTFESLVYRNVELFSQVPVDYIVTACATCTATISRLWPSLALPVDPALADSLKAVCRKTVDISWLMATVLDPGAAVDQPVKDAPCVTYHDPCHLKKSLGVFREPRKVIASAGYAVREMVQSDSCCGMGGSFNLANYDVSLAIGRQKADHIIQTGCPIVSTSCPACMMQLTDLLAGQGQQIEVRHPVELYARYLDSQSAEKS